MATKWHQINIRLNDEEFDLATTQAERAGLSIYQYAKQMTLKGRVRPAKPPIISPELGKLILTAISRMGNNVNQLSRRANSGGVVGVDELTAINEQLAMLLDYIATGKKPVDSNGGANQETSQEKLFTAPKAR